MGVSEEETANTYEVDGNVLTITCVSTYSSPRPSVGEHITGFSSQVVDASGDPLIIPEGGVEVTE